MRQRCKYSQRGISSVRPRKPERLGIIMPTDKRLGRNQVRVIWDGTKTPQTYHESFIEAIDEELPETMILRQVKALMLKGQNYTALHILRDYFMEHKSL